MMIHVEDDKEFKVQQFPFISHHSIFFKSPYIFICKTWTEVIASAELDCAYRSNGCYQNSN